MIELHQFPGRWGISSISPFCLKLETWMHMIELDFKVVVGRSTKANPKGKMPFIIHDGKMVADSGLIVSYLKETFNVKLDDALSKEQKAVGTAVTVMIEEHLYWAMVYSRWVDATYQQQFRTEVFSALPPVVRSLVPRMLSRNVAKTLHCQGIGRHTRDEIYQLAIQDLEMLTVLLADQTYFFGKEPTSLDATVFGFLANALRPPMETPIKQYIASKQNLVAFVDRVQNRYY